MSDWNDMWASFDRLFGKDDGVREIRRGVGTPLAGHGCICPPGAEKGCRGPMCPRRPLGASS